MSKLTIFPYVDFSKVKGHLTTYLVQIDFLLQFVIIPQNGTGGHFEIMQITYKWFSKLTVFPWVDFCRFLICYLGAHKELFGTIILFVVICSKLVQGIFSIEWLHYINDVVHSFLWFKNIQTIKYLTTRTVTN